jgi:broad specificity phosphatase PhoE
MRTMGCKIIFITSEAAKDNLNSNYDFLASPFLNKVDLIYSSTDIDTIHFIKPLAEKLNLKIIQNKNLDEVRIDEKYLPNYEFELEKLKQLEDLYYPAFGGETAIDALKRFSNEIKKIQNENQDKTIVVVSGKTILNLYFAKLQNNFNEIIDRWKNTDFGSIGIVEEGKVTKDLVRLVEDYPNIEKFLSEIGLVATYASKYKIVFKFVADKELAISEEDFSNVQENINSTDEDFDRVWANKQKYEKLFFPTLRPLLEKLNQFYEHRDTDYKHQIFLDTPSLEILNLSPMSLVYEFFNNKENYSDKIYKELKDFDNFLKVQ